MPEYETPDPAPSALRREIIDPGIEAGRLTHAAASAERQRSPEEPNAIQADLGYNDERAEAPIPEVVTHGYAPLLSRVVQNDGDIELQQSMVDAMRRAREERERARMDEEDRQRALEQVAGLRTITDPDGSRAAREAQRQAAIAEDEARRRMPPPDISHSA
jgi:hypothetical protein